MHVCTTYFAIHFYLPPHSTVGLDYFYMLRVSITQAAFMEMAGCLQLQYYEADCPGNQSVTIASIP